MTGLKPEVGAQYPAELSGGMMKRASLARAMALKDALTTRDEFLAVLSHDLRSPLSVIAMCSQELKLACHEKRLTEVESEWVAMIDRNCRTMTRLIRDLLDVEHMISGKIEIFKNRFDLNLFVTDFVHKLSSSTRCLTATCAPMCRCCILQPPQAPSCKPKCGQPGCTRCEDSR